MADLGADGDRRCRGENLIYSSRSPGWPLTPRGQAPQTVKTPGEPGHLLQCKDEPSGRCGVWAQEMKYRRSSPGRWRRRARTQFVAGSVAAAVQKWTFADGQPGLDSDECHGSFSGSAGTGTQSQQRRAGADGRLHAELGLPPPCTPAALSSSGCPPRRTTTPIFWGGAFAKRLDSRQRPRLCAGN